MHQGEDRLADRNVRPFYLEAAATLVIRPVQQQGKIDPAIWNKHPASEGQGMTPIQVDAAPFAESTDAKRYRRGDGIGHAEDGPELSQGLGILEVFAGQGTGV